MSKSDDLLSYLPPILSNIQDYQELAQAAGPEIEEFMQHIADVMNQFDVDTATWGLEKYEKELRIVTNVNKPIDERRSLIKAKRRGNGKLNSRLIKNIADSYTNGAVEVSFHGDKSEIHVKFTSFYGVPSNIEDLRRVLLVVIPAHLELMFDYTYLLIKDVHQVMTIGDLQATPLNRFAGGEM